jgi:hypothetical protein
MVMEEVIVTAKPIFAIWFILQGHPEPVESSRFEDRATCEKTLDTESSTGWGFSGKRAPLPSDIVRAYCDRASAEP